jgi:threonine/homoserine/homoserine lactone efflux protein
MLLTFLLGAAIGAITGIPIGPVNVAVIDAAYRHSRKRAYGVALGGGTADLLYAGLGIGGVGPFLQAHPAVPPILYAISGAVLVAYGAVTFRSQPPQALAERPPGATNGSAPFWAGFGLGLALIFLNPGALIAWVLIVGSFFGAVSTSEGLAAAAGVGVGSFAWFAFVAYLADHGKKVLGGKAVWMTRVVGMLLCGYGVFLLGRAGYHFWRLAG